MEKNPILSSVSVGRGCSRLVGLQKWDKRNSLEDGSRGWQRMEQMKELPVCCSQKEQQSVQASNFMLTFDKKHAAF